MTDQELDALFVRARARKVDFSRREYTFETRVMARVREERQADARSVWAMVSWRMLPIFATCMLALAILQTHMSNATDIDMAVSALDNPEGVVISALN